MGTAVPQMANDPEDTERQFVPTRVGDRRDTGMPSPGMYIQVSDSRRRHEESQTASDGEQAASASEPAASPDPASTAPVARPGPASLDLSAPEAAAVVVDGGGTDSLPRDTEADNDDVDPHDAQVHAAAAAHAEAVERAARISRISDLPPSGSHAIEPHRSAATYVDTERPARPPSQLPFLAAVAVLVLIIVSAGVVALRDLVRDKEVPVPGGSYTPVVRAAPRAPRPPTPPSMRPAPTGEVHTAAPPSEAEQAQPADAEQAPRAEGKPDETTAAAPVEPEKKRARPERDERETDDEPDDSRRSHRRAKSIREGVTEAPVPPPEAEQPPAAPPAAPTPPPPNWREQGESVPTNPFGEQVQTKRRQAVPENPFGEQLPPKRGLTE